LNAVALISRQDRDALYHTLRDPYYKVRDSRFANAEASLSVSSDRFASRSVISCEDTTDRANKSSLSSLRCSTGGLHGLDQTAHLEDRHMIGQSPGHRLRLDYHALLESGIRCAATAPGKLHPKSIRHL
jgi:hypothetical protein